MISWVGSRDALVLDPESQDEKYPARMQLLKRSRVAQKLIKGVRVLHASCCTSHLAADVRWG